MVASTEAFTQIFYFKGSISLLGPLSQSQIVIVLVCHLAGPIVIESVKKNFFVYFF